MNPSPPPTRPTSRAPHPAARSGTLTASLLVAALAACVDEAPRIDPRALGVRSVDVSTPACATPVPVAVDTLASGLEVPWDVAFLDDGSALVTERPGRIRLFRPDGVLDPEPWAEVPVFGPEGGEIGLMGIDVAPDGAHVYVTGTFARVASNPVGRLSRRLGDELARRLDPEAGHPVTLRVLRYDVAAAGPRAPSTVVEGIPSGFLHGGGALRFGPDGLLYVTNGDAGDHWRAQIEESRRGKILRFTADGALPASNPWAGSPNYATGIRHVQGLAWHPEGEVLLATDHGPTGLPGEDGRRHSDELNVVEAAANLGWPIVAGGSEGGDLTSPLVVWTPVHAPAGLAIYRGEHPAWHGSAFVTGLRGVALRRVELEVGADGVRAICQQVLLRGDHGRLRLVRQAPDGSVWVGTSNRDGRGVPKEGDDLILRLTPAGG